MTQVTEAYLLGVKEGRASLKAALEHGIDKRTFLKAELDNLKSLRKMGFSDEMRDTFKGHLDFVTNQLLDTVY